MVLIQLKHTGLCPTRAISLLKRGLKMDHVSWSLGLFSKTHLLEVDLTQNYWEAMAL